MAWHAGEVPEQARVLEIYHYRFLRWTGLGHEQALRRVNVSHLTLQRWLKDPGTTWAGLETPPPSWEPGPEENILPSYLVDTSQVASLGWSV